jgi:pimeloyl-ACP methyl ester carboxylesterase
MRISFSAEDGGRVCSDLYGKGPRAVVLVHSGRFSKESWRAQANVLVSEGFRVLAIDFRGFGCSMGPGQADFDNAPFENDVLAAVHYLKAHGSWAERAHRFGRFRARSVSFPNRPKVLAGQIACGQERETVLRTASICVSSKAKSTGFVW